MKKALIALVMLLVMCLGVQAYGIGWTSVEHLGTFYEDGGFDAFYVDGVIHVYPNSPFSSVTRCVVSEFKAQEGDSWGKWVHVIASEGHISTKLIEKPY